MLSFEHFIICVFSRLYFYLWEAFLASPTPKDIKKVIFMLSYWKNGKEVIVNSIYSDGRIGQVLILGENVDWGKSPDYKKHPLSKYPYLSVFTIVSICTHPENRHYVLCDSEGKNFILPLGSSSDVPFLYDIKTWLDFNAIRENEKMSRKQRKIETLESQVDLLKDILVKQGIRIVTEEQAKALGIKK